MYRTGKGSLISVKREKIFRTDDQHNRDVEEVHAPNGHRESKRLSDLSSPASPQTPL